MSALTFGHSINQALLSALDDERVFVIGEDICDPYGGAFKVTKGLSSRYPDRVLNTPISEAALTGVGIGMALRGYKPVVEIMFGDFLTLAADQLITNAAKLPWMFNDLVEVPLVVRAPMGGRRGYGATHSQSLEKLFLGVPGLDIIAPSIVHNPGTLLREAIFRHARPVLFIEHKTDYGSRLLESRDGMVDDIWFLRQGTGPWPEVLLSPTDFADDEITIMTYGGMVPLVIEAMTTLLYEKEICAQVVVPSMISGLDIRELTRIGMVDSLIDTGRLVLVEEGTLHNGWGAEICAGLMASGLGTELKAPVKRVASLDRPIGNARGLEDETLPGVEDIQRAVLACLGKG